MTNPSPWEHCLQHAAISDVGMRRANNQDAFQVALAADMAAFQHRGHLFVVADGMGAHAAGELASKLAVDNVGMIYHKFRSLSPPEALRRAVIETNVEIHRRGEANSDFHNMGTTVSALTLLPQGALVAHVGDSRVYRLRGESLQQLTFDHSLLWEMREAGHIQGDETSIPSNVITRSLGPKSTVQVDLEGPFPTEQGDTFLLCSDGLSGQVKDDELGPILRILPPGEAARVLVDLANLRGGPDNITCIVAKVVGPDLTSRVAAKEPLVVGQTEADKMVHPGFWVALGVAALASLLFFALSISNASFVIPGMVVGIGALLVGLYILLKVFGGLGGSEVVLGHDRMLGKGPHTTTPAAASDAFAHQMGDIVAELVEAVSGGSYEINRNRVNGYCQQARSAADNGQCDDAVRLYCQAISFIMSSLRNQRSQKLSDSRVDL